MGPHEPILHFFVAISVYTNESPFPSLFYFFGLAHIICIKVHKTRTGMKEQIRFLF